MAPNSSPSDDFIKRAQTEPLRARSLQVSLTVNDLEKSLAWYRDVLGFTVAERHEREGKLRAVSLEADEVRILIGQDDGAKGWDRSKGEGFSFQLTTDQDVDEIARRVRNAGGRLESEPVSTPWGARIFRLRDPDGFRLTISSVRPNRGV
jgi:lactoylglutathione lyase